MSFVAATLLFAAGCGPTAHHVTIPDIPCDSLRTADLAFRLGRTIESEIIASCDGGMRFSHIGIIVQGDSGAAVVHIEPSPISDERVRYDSAADFFRSDRASAGAVMRLKGLTDRQCDVIRDHALRMADSHIVFDHDYSMTDSARMYCTELVERVFASAGISLSQGRRHEFPLAKEPVILPSDIARNDSLAVVFNFATGR